MTVWKQERPAWCPHLDCTYRASSQGALCVGELPIPLPHGGDLNTHRLCMTHTDEGDAPWHMELEINRGDAWGLSRVLGRVFGFNAQAMSARTGQDRNGLGGDSPASPVGEADAPNPSGNPSQGEDHHARD